MYMYRDVAPLNAPAPRPTYNTKKAGVSLGTRLVDLHSKISLHYTKLCRQIFFAISLEVQVTKNTTCSPVITMPLSICVPVCERPRVQYKGNEGEYTIHCICRQ